MFTIDNVLFNEIKKTNAILVPLLYLFYYFVVLKVDLIFIPFINHFLMYLILLLFSGLFLFGFQHILTNHLLPFFFFFLFAH